MKAMLDILSVTYKIATRTDQRRLPARDLPGTAKRSFWQRLNRPTIDLDLDKL